MNNNDINGRIESFDQSVRSLDRRLRAVELRLSARKDDKGFLLYENANFDQLTDPAIQDIRDELRKSKDSIEHLTHDLETLKSNDLNSTAVSVQTIQHEILVLNDTTEELIQVQKSLSDEAVTSVEAIRAYHTEIEALKEGLDIAIQRIQRQENQNKVSFGSIKVPIELSGIIASIALLITGYLVWTDRWDIIRSTYFPSGLAVLFAAAVIVKFIVANREPYISP